MHRNVSSPPAAGQGAAHRDTSAGRLANTRSGRAAHGSQHGDTGTEKLSDRPPPLDGAWPSELVKQQQPTTGVGARPGHTRRRPARYVQVPAAIGPTCPSE